MSILLDALKKSEQQRQLGKAPTIHSPGDDAGAGQAAARPWVPMVLMATAAVAMAWIGWQQLREPPGLEQAMLERSASAPVDGEAGTAAAQSAEQSAPASEPQAAAAETVAATASDPEADGSGSAAEPVAARRPQLIARPASRTPVQSFKADTSELKNTTVMPPDVLAQDANSTRPDVSQSVRDFEAPAAEPSGAAAPRAAPVAEENPVAAASPGEPPAPAAEAEPEAMRPISYWELPQGVRDSLPELRITVLVYAERPEDRFVLIAGQRVIEKEQLGDGVVLDEIRRDGAVFEYRKYRFLVEG